MSEPKMPSPALPEPPEPKQGGAGLIDIAEVFAMTGFALLVIGLTMLAGAAVAVCTAGVILFALGLAMAWLRSR